jgi:glyoxylase-like metal-dependent hydrolase (beta-lactamase superfamily II)
LLHGYEGESELLPGIKVYEAAGHSDGVSVITINEDGAGDTAIFWADVVPTSHHIQPSYIMAYDMDVARSFESRSGWLAKAADASWLGLFYHDDRYPFGRISRAGKRYRFEPVEGQLVE